MEMDESEVTEFLRKHLSMCGLVPQSQYNLFDHSTDSLERSFRVDIAFAPWATKGERTLEESQNDDMRFAESGQAIDAVLSQLADAWVFPTDEDRAVGWTPEHNPNPMVGLAIEIENSGSKYLLGSILAACIAGRWGIVVVPDKPTTDLWLNTIRRMIKKCSRPPIPSNLKITKWPVIQQHFLSKYLEGQPR